MQKRYEHIEIRTNTVDYLREILNHSEDGYELIQVLLWQNLEVKVLMKRPIIDSVLSSIISESEAKGVCDHTWHRCITEEHWEWQCGKCGNLTNSIFNV